MGYGPRRCFVSFDSQQADMSSAFPMWLPKKLPSSSGFWFCTFLCSHSTLHTCQPYAGVGKMRRGEKRMSTVLKIAFGLRYRNQSDGDHNDDGYYGYTPSACLEVDGDNDEGDYDYAPAASLEGDDDDDGYDYAPAASLEGDDDDDSYDYAPAA
nr:hypothetical protein LSAT_5X97341 [Ipomoea batatas]